jgi:transcriptional regulator with XRE-family HTH domain/tetratricopeptide (TPR) repeat protein
VNGDTDRQDDFGGLLRRRRTEAGLTQEELAERATLSVRAIRDQERGATGRPYRHSINQLADALDLTGAERTEFTRAARRAPREVTGQVESRGPQQLPGEVADFTGRSAELKSLADLLETGRGPAGTVVVSAVGGTAGVGKTALAVHWAHQVAGQFPGGQLYVNLRGYDPDQPMAAADALAGFLRALGVAGQDIPADTEERAAKYRSVLAGQRVLVLLDNASSAEQVRPLLPASDSGVVVVTSRDTLAGLVARDGARRLDLDRLSLTDADRLLTTLIGDRAVDDAVATAALATACARLPLTLRVAAGLAVARPKVPLHRLVAELADERRRLDPSEAAGDPRTSGRAVFSWSYRQLEPAAARAFRLLGLHPGPDLELDAAAALTGHPLDRAQQLLDTLTRAHLVRRTGVQSTGVQSTGLQPAGTAGYGQHDLLRSYARELAAGVDGPDASRDALTRLFEHYLHTAMAAMDALYPAEQQQRPTAVPDAPRPPFAGGAETLAGLDAQREDLVAMGRFEEALAALTTALGLARRIDDKPAQARALDGLWQACEAVGDLDQARRHLTEAVTLHTELGAPEAEQLRTRLAGWQNRERRGRPGPDSAR